MNYKTTQAQLDGLNWLVGNVGGPIPSAVSNALAAMDVAKAAGDEAAYKKAFNDAVEANKKNGAAWGTVQQYCDVVKTQPLTGTPGDTDPGDEWTHYPPNFPENTRVVDFNGGDWGTVDLNMRYGVVVDRYNWGYFKAAQDGDVASMSCDGVMIAVHVGNAPQDPGNVGSPNTAESRPYKAGQIVSVKPLEGGYNFERALLFQVMKYA